MIVSNAALDPASQHTSVGTTGLLTLHCNKCFAMALQSAKALCMVDVDCLQG